MVAAIRDFTVAVDDVGPRHGNIAREDSPAMREIADEGEYAKRSLWTGPITDTHAHWPRAGLSDDHPAR